jgi:hypothetical protein
MQVLPSTTSLIGARMKIPPNLGLILLGVWLILFGILSAPFLSVRFSHSADVLAVFAIVTGAVLLLRGGK